MSRSLKIMFCLLVVGALMTGGLALADKPPKLEKECKWRNLDCPNDWAPVLCAKGGWFENRCYAKRACAKACRNFYGG